jgi:uncharacterized repeat protein (TIGR01451 family)
VTNTATATGTSVGGVRTPSNPSSAIVTIAATPELSIVKSSATTAITAAGQVVTYTFTVENTGNVTLDPVAVTDTDFSGKGTAPDMTGCDSTITSLAPGQSASCAATYLVVQADLDSGDATLSNTGSATGQPPTPTVGPPPPPITSPPSHKDIPISTTPGISLDKSADRSTVTAAGQQITYSFAVTNTGDVTVTSVHIVEVKFSGTGSGPDISTCPAQIGSLAPGQTKTCLATYTVTQADVDAGIINNQAQANGIDPIGDGVTSNDSSAKVTAVPAGGLSITKTASTTTINRAGQVITYTFTVTNTGTGTASDLNIVDSGFTGTGTLSAIRCPSTTVGVGQVVVCTATYTVTASDLDDGDLSNTAVAIAKDGSGGSIASNQSAVKVTPTTQLPFTGVTSELYLIIAGLLIGSGLLLAFAGRRYQA